MFFINFQQNFFSFHQTAVL